MARIAATSQEDGRGASIEVGSTEIVLARTVTRILLTPYSGIFGRRLVVHILSLARLKAWQWVEHGCPVVLAVPSVRLTRQSVQVEQVLLAVVGIFLAGGLSLAVVVGHVTDIDGLARSSMDNHVIGTTHQHLGLTIEVPVVAYHIPLFIRPCHHVGTEVYPPQTGAVHLVALVKVEVSGIRRLTQVTLVVVALDDKFGDAITVDIGQGHVVDGIAGRRVGTVGCAVADSIAGTVDDGLQHHVEIGFVPSLDGNRLVEGLTLDYGLHLISRGGIATSILVIRCIQVGGYLRAVTIEIVLRVVVLFAETTPTDERTTAGRQGDDASVQLIHIALSVSLCGHHSQEGKQ